jgi:hypothetical protein
LCVCRDSSSWSILCDATDGTEVHSGCVCVCVCREECSRQESVLRALTFALQVEVVFPRTLRAAGRQTDCEILPNAAISCIRSRTRASEWRSRRSVAPQLQVSACGYVRGVVWPTTVCELARKSECACVVAPCGHSVRIRFN